MARWRLLAKHYLWVGPENEWERVETNRDTGRQARSRVVVPQFFDPDTGEIIVCDGNNPRRGDVIFYANRDGAKGLPTPDMEPMDEEAEAITESMRATWTHAIESLPTNGDDFGSALALQFERAIEKMMTVGGPAQAPSASGTVDPAEFKRMQEQLAQLMARNAELESAPTRRAL